MVKVKPKPLNVYDKITGLLGGSNLLVALDENFNFSFNLFHPFDNNVYRIHPSFLILSFYNSV